MRRIALFFLVITGLYFLSGCSPKGKQETTPKLMLQAPLRAFLMPLEGDEGVLEEDVYNIGLYLKGIIDALPHIDLVQNEAAKADLQRKINYQNTVTLRRMGETHLVEAVLRGRVHKFSYHKDRNHLNLQMDLTLLALNTFTGEKFFEVSRNFSKRYRVRNARNRDFSGQNKRFLRDSFGELLLEFHRRVYALAEAQKERNGGVFPTKLVSASQSSTSSEPQLMHVLLWPIDSSGQALVKTQAIAEKPAISGIKQSTQAPSVSSSVNQNEEHPLVSKTMAKASASWRQRAKRLAENYKSTKQSNSRPPSKVVESKVNMTPKAQTDLQNKPRRVQNQGESGREKALFNLEMPGYQLVYPAAFSGAKKYQKFYYLIDDITKKRASVEDLNSASKETVVLEIFSTADDKAVKRFMDDYFHGVQSNPKGKIPEVYERIYAGKYQVGFRVEDKAVVATADRDSRDRILGGLEAIYVNNGGVSVARIIARSFKNGKRATDIIFEDVQTIYEEQSEANNKQPARSSRRSNSPKAQASSSSVEKPPASGDYDVPVSSSSERTTIRKRRQELASKPREKKAPTPVLPKTPAQAVKNALPANAVFFFDMARGYYQSGDFETALRYFQLAEKNGYEVPELQEYIGKVREELGKNPPRLSPPTPELKVPSSTLEYEEFDYERWRKRANTNSENVTLPENPLPQAPVKVEPLKQSPADPKPSKIEPPEKPMEEFYKEMQKMESEIQRYLKGKSKLSTVARYSQRISFTEFLIQVIFLVASTLAIISFISSQKGK